MPARRPILGLLGALVSILLLSGCGASDRDETGPADATSQASNAQAEECDASQQVTRCRSEMAFPGEPPRLKTPDELLCQAPDETAASERLEGISFEKAEEILDPTQCSLRLVKLDGRSLAVTSDLVKTRINVVVRDGVIVRIDGLY